MGRHPHEGLVGRVCACLRGGRLAWVRVRPSDGREPPLVSSRHYLKACRVVAVLGADTVVADRFGRWLLPRGTGLLLEVPQDAWRKIGFAPVREPD